MYICNLINEHKYRFYSENGVVIVNMYFTPNLTGLGNRTKSNTSVDYYEVRLILKVNEIESICS